MDLIVDDYIAVIWDATAEMAVSALIREYLEAHPPPPGAVVAEDLGTWSDLLLRSGQARLVGAEVAA